MPVRPTAFTSWSWNTSTAKTCRRLVKKNGPFPVNKAVNYILQAARGLEFAHSEGRHSPRHQACQSAARTTKASVKILDMGLARLDSSVGAESGPQAELTGTGTIMGTVDYMAPEQALDTKHADARADIYSLGISLYYLLAGRAAFDGDTVMKKLLAHREQPIPSLQDTQTTVSKQLDAVFKKMVAKRVEDRYQTMSEVVEALERLGFRRFEQRSGWATLPAPSTFLPQTRRSCCQGEEEAVGVDHRCRGFGEDEASASPRSSAEHSARSSPRSWCSISFGTWRRKTSLPHRLRQLHQQRPCRLWSWRQIRRRSRLLMSRMMVHPSRWSLPSTPMQAKAGQAAWAKHLGTKVETINSVGMRLTLIPPGEFLMGSTPEQIAVGRKMGEDDKMPPTDTYFGRLAEEMPQHKVTISQPFLMGSTEVTVAQFRKFVEASKYDHRGGEVWLRQLAATRPSTRPRKPTRGRTGRTPAMRSPTTRR